MTGRSSACDTKTWLFSRSAMDKCWNYVARNNEELYDFGRFGWLNRAWVHCLLPATFAPGSRSAGAALTASCRQTETSHWPDRQNSSSLADGRGVQAVRKVRAKDANIKALTHCLTCPLKKWRKFVQPVDKWSQMSLHLKQSIKVRCER